MACGVLSVVGALDGDGAGGEEWSELCLDEDRDDDDDYHHRDDAH